MSKVVHQWGGSAGYFMTICGAIGWTPLSKTPFRGHKKVTCKRCLAKLKKEKSK